ncbi:MAG: hypothetical protein FIA94_08685 [Nitrospirae bacterium]|nr:hypothetical protein [Nitrospirota bacterium]
MNIEERIRRAHTVQGDELWSMIRDAHPQVILNATMNRNLTEEMALVIAKKRNAPAEALGFLAGDARFKDSQKLKLALCRNPKTPQRIIFSLLKFLRVFELGDLTRDQNVPVTVRQKIELMIQEKIPALPAGIRSALAKRSSTNIVLALMNRSDRQVIRVCLDSHMVTEAHLWTLINQSAVRPAVVLGVCEHPLWSLRYNIKYALIRNYHTPMAHIIRFIPDMKTIDLRELYSDESISSSARPYIFSELKERGESTEIQGDEVFELEEGTDLPDIPSDLADEEEL